MFSILRFVLIVGAIFYYSPVRQGGDGSASVESLFGVTAGTAVPNTAADAATDRLEAMWQALPGAAKQAVMEKLLTTSGLESPDAKANDTLLPTDRRLAPSKSQ
jgi:glycerate kinase